MTSVPELNPVVTDRTCIVCGGRRPFSPVYERHGFTLVRCRGCRLVFQDPQPSDDALAETYYHDEEWTRIVLGPLNEKLTERAASQLAMLAQAGIRADGGKLLDVGCSAGSFMALAERAGWRTTGVELGASTAQAARDRCLDVHTGTLEDTLPDLEPASCSLITFWDVLEHLRDPRVELTLARRLLRPGGAVAATMPNVGGLYPRVTYRLIARRTGRWEYPELPVHLYDFSPATITQLLVNAGFEGVRVRTFATPFWYYRWTSLSLASLGGRVRGRLLRGVFEALHAVLYPAAQLADQSNSLFVVARLREPV